MAWFLLGLSEIKWYIHMDGGQRAEINEISAKWADNESGKVKIISPRPASTGNSFRNYFSLSTNRETDGKVGGASERANNSFACEFGKCPTARCVFSRPFSPFASLPAPKSSSSSTCVLLPFVGFDERMVHDSSKYFFNDRSILKNNNNKLLRLPRPPSQPQYSKPTHHITPFFVLMKTNGEKELLTVLFQGRTEMNARTWSLFLSGSEFAVRT